LQIINKSEILKDKLSELNSYNNNLNKLKEENSLLENKFSGLIITNNNLNTEKKNIEKSIKEYTDKKSNIIKFANEVIADLKKLKESKEKLSEINYDQINSLNEIVNGKKESLTKNNVIIQNNISKIEELKIPLPLDAECRHCRQVLSDEHKINCQLQIDKELKDCQLHIGLLKKENVLLNSELLEAQKDINYLNNSKKELDKIIDSISFKEQELKDKKALHKEYLDLLSKFENDLKEVEEKIKLNLIDLQSSSQEESNKIKQLIEKQSVDIDNLNKEIALINKELSHNNSLKAVLAHNIEQKEKEKIKKEELKKSLEELNNKYTVYPNVLQAFSSTGIPNLIIQNVLDDLQVEANNLLIQLNPALQLNFATEKTKTDGSEAETLDINYFLNGKERQYDQLSGAQKLSVTFSLKLGLSFLLQKMIGTNIKFLLLDEIDQALDKASVDAFANIVKHFQKDFTILVITHNDRLKDKFKHSVLVEQDINMISRARVFNSY
jgi:DNA repair exonuclease SbcCD ATPase subunit